MSEQPTRYIRQPSAAYVLELKEELALSRRNLQAMSDRAAELARRVTALEMGLTEALDCLETHDDEHPYLVRLRALASGT